MAPRRLQVAVAGLGRMGARHALNILNKTPRAELVAAFSPDEKELQWGKQHLEPFGVKLYNDYDAMLTHTGLDAVVIGTATSVHAEETIKAMEKDLHVLCEKPLSTSVKICQDVVDAAKKNPHLKVMCGFSRRFDDSYQDVAQKIESGAIGRPTILRSQTCDKNDPSGFFVAYAAWSGGVFVDMSVHDIDLTLWYFGSHVVPKSISAYGVVATQPGLKQYNDYDNAVGIVEFWDGRIAHYYASRMMPHGQEDVTEIIGTEGKLTVNLNPQKNLVNYYHAGGITREVPHDYWGRFEGGFVKEANEFAAACLDDTPVPLEFQNAVKAVQIGAWLQEALVSGKQLTFDEQGRRQERANL
ncbi:NAD(P)-binding protein [Plenodomus tracheiphilus IPT5]|uniref:NAD(P)-binding protein n=1 Tax=Plenodomus tracheiphilus IPT5 TaxID=1408161 RepID=A0A6A7BH55_9PLEO|nr:NAD(P)-binding protein [Plenodomus tracheiphilus IPT5]